MSICSARRLIIFAFIAGCQVAAEVMAAPQLKSTCLH